MSFPKNEAETISLFQLIEQRIGWRIVHLQRKYPDAVIENDSGDKLICEFEYQSRNFQCHNHDPERCDLIICWEDNWPDSPIPVQALKDCANGEASIIGNLVSWFRNAKRILEEGYQILRRENTQLRVENADLKEQIGQLKYDLDLARSSRDRYEASQLPWQGRNRLGDMIWYSENWEDRARMQQFLAYALSWEPVSAYLDMMLCGGGNAPPGTESRKVMDGRANDMKWDYWDGWEAERW